jgi:hypothetical protein
LPKDARGYLLTERDLRVPGFENVWALGDCAVNPDPSGSPYQATAQHAIRQGKHAALDITRVTQGRSTRPCNIESSGSLAALDWTFGLFLPRDHVRLGVIRGARGTPSAEKELDSPKRTATLPHREIAATATSASPAAH